MDFLKISETYYEEMLELLHDSNSHNRGRSFLKYSNCEVKRGSGSTDTNIPHSLGIPAICVGVYIGGGAHTTEEWLLKESLKPGFAIGMELILTEVNLL